METQPKGILMKDRIKRFCRKHESVLIAAAAASGATTIAIMAWITKVSKNMTGNEVMSLDLVKLEDGSKRVLLYLKDGTTRTFEKNNN